MPLSFSPHRVRARSDQHTPSPRGERRGIQIGPRIRVGGTLGHIGQQAKETLGKIDKKAAPFVAMIPGVGQIAAPIMNIAGNALDTSNGGGIKSLGDIGRVGLESALMAGGGKLLSGLGKIPMVGSAIHGIEGAVSSLPGVSAVTSAAQKAGDVIPQSAKSAYDTYLADQTSDPSTAPGASPSGGSVIPRLADGSIDWGKLLQLGLGAGAAYEGVKNSQAESKAQQQALQLSTQDAANRAAMYKAGMDRMNQPGPDLSYLSDPTNPYTPKRKAPAVGQGAMTGGY